MSDVTPSGADDNIEVTNVDSAADYIFQKRMQQQEEGESQEPETTEEVEELSEETELEAQAEEEVESEEDEQEAIEVEQEASFSTVDELAEALEVDSSDLLDSLMAKAKVNGKELDVTLREALNGYQRESDYTEKTERLSQEKRDFEAEKAKQLESINQNLQNTNAVANYFVDELNQAYQSVDWNALRNENPSEYVAQQQDYQNRLNLINQIKEHSTQQAQQFQAEQLQAADQKAREELRQTIPSWSDPQTEANELADLQKFLVDNYGFHEQEVKLIGDPRYGKAFYDLMKGSTTLQKVETKKDVAKKRVKKLPKVLKPGERKQVSAKSVRVKEAAKRLKKTGSTNDVAELLLAKRKS